MQAVLQILASFHAVNIGQSYCRCEIGIPCMCNAEMVMGQWVKGHGSNDSPFLGWVTWVNGSDPCDP